MHRGTSAGVGPPEAAWRGPREGGAVAGERRRRLAAILAADVVGYSRLVGAGEEGTPARPRALLPGSGRAGP